MFSRGLPMQTFWSMLRWPVPHPHPHPSHDSDWYTVTVSEVSCCYKYSLLSAWCVLAREKQLWTNASKSNSWVLSALSLKSLCIWTPLLFCHLNHPNDIMRESGNSQLFIALDSSSPDPIIHLTRNGITISQGIVVVMSRLISPKY